MNNLSGTIPPSIYNLSSLYEIGVAKNQLHGRIAQDTGFMLPNLTGLFVTLNQFTGPIPVSLSNASGLEVLGFAANSFTGTVPQNLGSLRNLTILTIAVNQLETNEPQGFSFLTSLTNCSYLQMLDRTI